MPEGPGRRVRRPAVSGYDAGRRWLLGPAVEVPARTWNTREPSGTPTWRNGGPATSGGSLSWLEHLLDIRSGQCGVPPK